MASGKRSQPRGYVLAFPLTNGYDVSLQERLAVKPANKPPFILWLENLPADELAALEKAGRDRRWSNADILRAIQAEGQRVSKETVSKWRSELS